MKNWTFCDGSNCRKGNSDEFGMYLDLTITMKGKGQAKKEEQKDEDKGKKPKEYELGGGAEILLSSQVGDNKLTLSNQHQMNYRKMPAFLSGFFICVSCAGEGGGGGGGGVFPYEKVGDAKHQTVTFGVDMVPLWSSGAREVNFHNKMKPLLRNARFRFRMLIPFRGRQEL